MSQKEELNSKVSSKCSAEKSSNIPKIKALMSILRDKEKRTEVERKLGLSNIDDFSSKNYLAPYRCTHNYQSASQIIISLANISQADTVYELGSGDARVLAEISQHTGCHGIGIELNETLVEKSRKMLDDNNLCDRVHIISCDFCSAEIKATSNTVVYLYVTAQGIESLYPKLISVLKGGGRIVSYTFALLCKGHSTQSLHPVTIKQLPGVPQPYGKYYYYDSTSLK